MIELRLPCYGSTGKAADEELAASIYNSGYARARVLAAPRSESDIERQLNEYGIDYYLAWAGKSAPVPAFVRDLKDVTRGELPQLKIYRWQRR